MAHPPPARPQAAPAPDQAALDEVRAQQIEQHVDLWLDGQRHATPQTVEVSIGERDSIRPEVQALVCAKYAKAGWSQAKTAQDIEDGEIRGIGGVLLVAGFARPDPRGIVLTLVP